MIMGDCGAFVLSLASWVIYFARVTKAKYPILPHCVEGEMEEMAHKAMEWGLCVSTSHTPSAPSHRGWGLVGVTGMLLISL